jgi:hypothetical protein
MMDPISDALIFGLCIGFFALLIAPLASAEGADDALATFLIKRQRILARERAMLAQRARSSAAFAPLRERSRKPRQDGQRPPLRAQKRTHASKTATKTAKRRRAT